MCPLFMVLTKTQFPNLSPAKVFSTSIVKYQPWRIAVASFLTTTWPICEGWRLLGTGIRIDFSFGMDSERDRWRRIITDLWEPKWWPELESSIEQGWCLRFSEGRSFVDEWGEEDDGDGGLQWRGGGGQWWRRTMVMSWWRWRRGWMKKDRECEHYCTISIRHNPMPWPILSFTAIKKHHNK